MPGRHKYKIFVKRPTEVKKESEYYVDEFRVWTENGVVICHTKSDDGAQRWISVPEGSLTVMENGGDRKETQEAKSTPLVA